MKVGTVFEASHVPMRLWLQAMALICASKKGISSNQLHRTLGVTLKTAWFMSHRIREECATAIWRHSARAVAMSRWMKPTLDREPGAVKQASGYADKMKVLSLVDRSTGRARSFVMDDVNSKTVGEIVAANMAKEARLLTDQASYYLRVGKTFSAHASVNHGADEYVSKLDPTVHTNTVEGFYSIFKRGISVASISTVASSTFTATWLSSIFATPTASPWRKRYRPHRPCAGGYRREAPHLSNSLSLRGVSPKETEAISAAGALSPIERDKP